MKQFIKISCGLLLIAFAFYMIDQVDPYNPAFQGIPENILFNVSMFSISAIGLNLILTSKEKKEIETDW